MYNSYATSTVYSIRSNCPVSHSLNRCPIFSNERCYGISRNVSKSSPCCCSCSCCVYYAFPIPRLSVCPSVFNGSRQSTLLQSSISRRLLLSGRNRFRYSIPEYGRVLDCCEVPCSVSRRCCMNCESDESDGFDEEEDIAEAMISLIRDGFDSRGRNRAADVGKRGKFGGEERNRSSSRRVELEKRIRNVEEKRLSSFEKMRVDRKRDFDRVERKTDKFDSLNSRKNNKVGSMAVELRKNGYRVNGDQLVHSKGDTQSLRKEESICSSYYSLSSSGDIEDDAEVEDKNVQFVEEFSSGYGYKMKNVEEKLDGEIKEEFKKHGDGKKGREEEYVEDDTTVENRADLHLRKNSEKKLSDVSTRVTTSASEISEMNSKSSRTRKSDYISTSSSKEEELKMGMTLNKQSKQNVSGKKVSGVFINEGKKLSEVSEISCSNAEEISRSQKTLTIKNASVELDTKLIKEASKKSHETVRPALQQKSSRRTSSFQQLLGVSENRKTERERISHQASRSDTVMNASESTDVRVTSNQEVEENNHQIGNSAIREMDTRKKFLHLGVISVIKEGNTNTSISSSEVQTENEEQIAASVNASNLVDKDKKSSTDQKAPQRVISRKGSQDTNKISSTQCEKTFENRIFKQETNKSSVEKTVKESIIRSEEEKKISQAVLIPPPSQLVARNPLRIDSTSEMASQLVSRKPSRSSSGGSRKSYRQSGVDESIEEPGYIIAPDDTLSSADRLERSSAQFVGEFIEKSKNELLISKIQKKENISEVDLLHEERHEQKNYLDYQTKAQDSRLSSRSSGTKGPSDEMWHEMDSTTEQPPKTDNPEISAVSETAIVKRSGRSLWNLISDIARLRWNSRAETSDSALRSESASNETWFSGREHEETDNTKIGRTTAAEFTSSSYRLEEPNPSSLGQNLSDDKKEKNIYYEADTSSSPLMETKIPGGTLLVSGEAVLTDGRKVEVISSGSDIERLSLPPSPQGIRGSLVIEEISHSGKTDAFASSSAEQLGGSSDATLPDISTTGSKDGEVKQRKLQRNKQVLKDRFDEWEDAFILETEQRKMDEMFMREALVEARRAADTWEVPVGAVLVKHGKIIARGYNLVEELRDSTAHAEMICIREASKQLKTWRLAETTLYVTLEPCPMCAGAILQARVENLVWGAPNKLLGADGSWIRLFPDGGEGNVSEQSEKPAAPVHPFHPNMTIRRGVLASECADVMQQFFQLRRRKKQKKENAPPLLVARHPSKFITKMHNIFHLLFCL